IFKFFCRDKAHDTSLIIFINFELIHTHSKDNLISLIGLLKIREKYEKPDNAVAGSTNAVRCFWLLGADATINRARH
ncbi:hypothetical protein, partial [Shewanella sairae]|uniref:hypothetical protein n=1 Tax=Shewanella sairae TaxID=190310 RepID=UPI001C804CAE